MKSFLLLMVQFISLSAFSQPSDAKILCADRWLLEKKNSEGEYVYKKIELSGSSVNVTDKTTIVFKSDGSFFWSDNPSCGTNIGATNGTGKWKLNPKTKELIMDYQNTFTACCGERGKEKFNIIKLTAETMILK